MDSTHTAAGHSSAGHARAIAIPHPIAAIPTPQVVQRVQHDGDTVKPKVKVRAHLVCICIAIMLTIVVPHILHSEVFAAVTVWTPNVLQETLDRIFHL